MGRLVAGAVVGGAVVVGGGEDGLEDAEGLGVEGRVRGAAGEVAGEVAGGGVDTAGPG